MAASHLPFAILCSEGFYCNSGTPGAHGICEPCVPEVCASMLSAGTQSSSSTASSTFSVSTVGEREKCNGSVSPAYAVLCSDGLYCNSTLPGAGGLCVKCVPEVCGGEL